ERPLGAAGIALVCGGMSSLRGHHCRPAGVPPARPPGPHGRLLSRAVVTSPGRSLLVAALILLPGTLLASDIVIGMSAAFTGPSEAIGIELYRGSMAYLEPVNRAGGINGKRIVIRAYDDGYDPTLAIRNTIRLVDDDNVLLLMNFVGTPTVTRVLPLVKTYQKQHVYLFFPFTGARP